MIRRIHIPVANIVVILTDDGGTVSSDLDGSYEDSDWIRSSMPPLPEYDEAFDAARQKLYAVLLAHAERGIDLTSDAYVAGVRAAVEALAPYRPHGRRWGYP